jgi:hypothetical protein
MRNSFIYNSYNILGLPIDSSQKDINTRINNIGKIITIGETGDGTVFESDLYIDSKERTQSLINECKSRLNDPVDRMTDYFFWFTIKTEADKQIVSAIMSKDMTYIESLYASGDYFQKKNAAIALSIIFEKSQFKTDFENALVKWDGFIHDDTFWSNWTKLYQSFDYLDTSSRLIDSYRDDIYKIISEKFFAVSELDDAIDAQIVNKYIEVSNETFEKVIEPYILKIRDYKAKLSAYHSSNSLLSSDHMISAQIKDDIVQLLKQSVKIYDNLKEAKLLDNPKITHQLNDLWNDFLSFLIKVHNEAMKHDSPRIENWDFLKQIIVNIEKLSTDPILDDRIKKSNDIAVKMIEELKERKLVEPYYSQLEDLLKKLTTVSFENETAITGFLNSYVSICTTVNKSGLMKYNSILQLITAIAGTFNMIAVEVSNAAQEVIGKRFQQFANAPQYSKQSIALEIKAIAPDVIDKLRFSQTILGRIKSVQIDAQLKETIVLNYDSITKMIISFNKSPLNTSDDDDDDANNLVGCVIPLVIVAIIIALIYFSP